METALQIISQENEDVETSTYVPVIIRAKAPLKRGETLYVCGNIQSLGMGILYKSLQMRTSNDHYPFWEAVKPIFVRPGTELSYRYLVFSGGQFDRYEREGLRTVKIDSMTEVTINDNVVDSGNRQDGLDPRDHSSSQGNLFSDDAQSCSNQSTSTYETHQIHPFESSLLDIFKADKEHFLSPHSSSEERKRPSKSGLIIVSYFLPVILRREVTKINKGEERVHWTAEWDANEFLSPKRFMYPRGTIDQLNDDIDRFHLTYIGFPKTDNPIAVEEQDLVIEALAKLKCVPVFLDEQLHQQAYYGYAIGTLFEIFHGVIDVLGEKLTRFWDGCSQEQKWKSFSKMNIQFVQSIVEAFNQGDIVWIHGVELILLPNYLARKLRSSHPTIGYFIHSPFPSSEIFRTLSVRNELLLGMLGADHIGFHVYEHIRHFTTCCKRILGLTTETCGKGGSGALNVLYEGRHVNLTTCYAGIDPNFIRYRLSKPDILDMAMKIRNRAFPGSIDFDQKKIIYDRNRILLSCIDDSNRLQGAFFQLLAFERFLNENPEYKSIVHFIQYTTLLPYTSNANQKVIDDCQTVANRINERFPGTILFELRKQPIGIDERLALWTSSDILFRTPIREGLCLYPFEFLVAASTFNREPLVILSDFSVECRNLSGVFRVNPMRMDEISNAIVESLKISPAERRARFVNDYSFVNMQTIDGWVKATLKDITQAHTYNVGIQVTDLGLGAGSRLIGFRSTFTRLQEEDVIRSYRKSSLRLFLLDYGGTTVRDDPLPNKYEYRSLLSNAAKMAQTAFPAVKEHHLIKKPSSKLIKAFEVLCADPRNVVCIVSGREKQELEEAFGKAPVLSLIAEHGLFYSWGSTTPQASKENQKFSFLNEMSIALEGSQKKKLHLKREWQMLGDHYDSSWKDIVKAIMRVYTARTCGTYIEDKGNSILWQFYDADSEFGKMQAQELCVHLENDLKTFAVSVELGKTSVEVGPNGCNKGTASLHVIESLLERNLVPDFILSMGDDIADEKMFKMLEEKLPRLQEVCAEKKVDDCDKNPVKMFTCVVGKKPSDARYYLDDVDEVEGFLDSLAFISKKDSQHEIDMNLRNMYSGSVPPEPNADEIGRVSPRAQGEFFIGSE